MSRNKKPEAAERGRKKLVFGRRFSGLLDEDVIVLLNATVARGVEWDSRAHAVNAGLRQALIPMFKPKGAPIHISHFEQVVFTKPIHSRKR